MEDKIREIKEHIKKVYLTYSRPFVVGFSGGKDSSATLQIVWEAIEELPRDQVSNDIHVISTDTLVETPYIIDYIIDSLRKINESARAKNLPIYAHRLIPLLENSFWVNLIGKGYPAPQQQFRWCTERLKIEPVNRFIAEYVNKWGEVTVVLGARREESASRSQVLSKRIRDVLGLSKHPTLPSAYVFTPIEDLTTDEVWSYLLNTKCPWGGSNRDLAAMYQNAGGGECPTVVDKSTPSCGSSRFGCWVCTVVKRDTSMENLIDSGEEWMTPLLEFRDLLSETQNPESKSKYRNYKRRNGRVSLVRDGTRIAYGPYKLEWRKEFLKRLLRAQKNIQETKSGSHLTLISMKELEMIRNIWREEEYDWEDSLPKIYKEQVGKDYPWNQEDGVLFTKEDLELLENLCEMEGIQVGLVAKLIDQERKTQGMNRRAGIINKIDQVLQEEWRTEEELIESIESNQ